MRAIHKLTEQQDLYLIAAENTVIRSDDIDYTLRNLIWAETNISVDLIVKGQIGGELHDIAVSRRKRN